MKIIKIVCLLAFLFILQACGHYSTFTSVPTGAKVRIGKAYVSGTTPLTGKVGSTTFGRYPVKVQKDGYETLYGNLPLKVRGGRIVLDALLFAPAAFFNTQTSLPFYEFDLEQGVIKYKVKKNHEWLIYQIPEDQKEAARQFFGD
jgi:hypothetical protein